MKYFAVDIETTGLDPSKDQILEIGVIFEDTENQLSFEECPKFHAILNHPRIEGDPKALAMNARLLDVAANQPEAWHKDAFSYSQTHRLFRPDTVSYEFVSFVNTHLKQGPRVFAGKNIGAFDLQFLQKMEDWHELFGRIHTIDPAPLYLDFRCDKKPPSLAVCLERAGMKNEYPHHALHDAWAVVQLFRHYQSSMPS